MATSSSVQDIKHKSKLPQYGARNTVSAQAGRDKPLFTSMRRAQFQQDFTTDSLNNTAIGTPSPAKPSNTLSNRIDRPTRGVGLGAAFRRLDERGKNDENKDIASQDVRRGNESGHGQQRGTGSGIPTRPTLSRQHLTEAPTPSPKNIPMRTRARTPSPPRGRSTDILQSPMSEVSESSPPREFAEAYKQINDQEDLAALEEDLDSDEDTEEMDDQLHRAEPRSSRRCSRRRSPGVDDAIILDAPKNELVEITNTSVPSLPSDLETDVSQLSRHQKDLRRLDLALGDRKSFSKASRRPKLGTIEAGSDAASSRSGSHSDNSNTSGSMVSDGSLNIPNTWGRKARHGKTWLSRLERDMQIKNEEDDSKKAGDSKVVQARNSSVGDWQAEASMTPLPSGQDQDSLEHSPSPAPTKISSLLARDRVRKLAFGEDRFLTKTHEDIQARARNPALNIIREREIENLAKSAVTTNRLGELKERRSLERVGNRSATSLSEHEQAEGIKVENEPIVRSKPLQPLFETVKSEEPEHGKIFLQDKQMAEQVQKPPSFKSTLAVDSIQHTDLSTPMPNRSNVPQTYLKTPLVTGAWIDTPMPAIKSENLQDNQGMNQKKDAAPSSGEKGETEAVIIPKKEEPDSHTRQEILKATAPKLPGSALAAIITHAKDKKAHGILAQTDDTLLLDDSTILSLEEFVASGEDSGTETTDSEDIQTENRIRSAKPRSKTSRFAPRASDSEGEVEMTTRLNRLRTSIQDAKMGVGSLEKRIRKLPERNASVNSSRASSRSRAQSECEEAGEFHDFIWPCEKCGHNAGSTLWDNDEASIIDWHWRPIQIYMPKLWFWPSSTAKLPRLTQLGRWSILCGILLITEFILHSIYSPPFYASSMSGYGVNLHAPHPPFVLPKLIWNNILSTPLENLRLLLQTFVRLFASVLGVEPGSFAGSEPDAWSGDSRHIYSLGQGRGSGSGSRGAFYTDTQGMDTDEYL